MPSDETRRELGADVGLCCVETDGETCLVVTGTPENAHLDLVPTTLIDRSPRRQSVAGTFDDDGRVVRFRPRLPLVPGMLYSLLVDGVVEASIEVPAVQAVPTTEVVSIHPSAVEVPLNLLRVYISFSARMSEGCASQAVSIERGDTGEKLRDVFLHVEPELWDRSRRRLTLLLDPARIKRGLGLTGASEYPLVEGTAISVIVDESFRDATGQRLRARAERRYRVGAASRTRVDPFAWQLVVPSKGSGRQLVVELDRSLDRPQLERFVTVLDSDDGAVSGQVSVEDGERVWRFAPTAPWRSGRYVLRVDSRLEDVAGNSVRRVFDRDLELPDDEPLDATEVETPFEVR